MSSTNREIRRRICIWYEYKLGSSVAMAKENLDRVFGEAALSQSSIRRWYRKFREGDESLEVNTERYSLVDDDELEMLRKDNPQMKVTDLAERFGVRPSTIWNHLGRIAKGKKMKFIAEKHEAPVSAVQLIAKPKKKKHHPGAIPQQIVFRSTVIPEADIKKRELAEEVQETNNVEGMAYYEEVVLSTPPRCSGQSRDDGPNEEHSTAVKEEMEALLTGIHFEYCYESSMWRKTIEDKFIRQEDQN
ncbi:hypothetical protein Y032_0074g828 [Ancylostoma ceylanicum]|uniref:Mos1 transposase HTH domain-containing protein n=2 Tax=Ancylostoma ceylanicum TaxID=53326 RepID=A0A016TV50_9BILA|nr:hypothetical protein Y032_0074g828 [Ancylostoma ceylanicum]